MLLSVILNGRVMMIRNSGLATTDVLNLETYTEGVYLIVVDIADGSRHIQRVTK